MLAGGFVFKVYSTAVMSLNASQELSSANTASERILVLDFGSQYAQLIARRVREQNVYCEIVRHDITPEQIKSHSPVGLILSGGPSSVYESDSPKCHPGIFEMDIPVSVSYTHLTLPTILLV